MLEKMKAIFRSRYPKELCADSIKGSEIDYTLKDNLLDRYYIGRRFIWNGHDFMLVRGGFKTRRRDVKLMLLNGNGEMREIEAGNADDILEHSGTEYLF